jgi:hypothetical protein
MSNKVRCWRWKVKEDSAQVSIPYVPVAEEVPF